MKKMLSFVALLGLICGGLLTGCQKKADTTTPSTPTPSTNAPATTNAPAQ